MVRDGYRKRRRGPRARQRDGTRRQDDWEKTSRRLRRNVGVYPEVAEVNRRTGSPDRPSCRRLAKFGAK